MLGPSADGLSQCPAWSYDASGQIYDNGERATPLDVPGNAMEPSRNSSMISRARPRARARKVMSVRWGKAFLASPTQYR